MAGSLKDQLLKAGLVDKKQVNRAAHEKRAKRKKNKGKKATPEINAARQEQLKKQERSRELNRQANVEKQAREIQAQVKQLVADNALDLKNHDQAYHFRVGTKIKKVYVDKEISDKLSRGQLAIVQWDGRYEVVPARTAVQVAQRDASALVMLHAPE